MYELARLYEAGLGVEKNLDTARELYRRAADAGDEEARLALARLEAGLRGAASP